MHWLLGAGTRAVKTSIRPVTTVKVPSNLNTSQIEEGKLKGASSSLLNEMRLINARITKLGIDTQRALEEIQKDATAGNMKSDLGMANDQICEESDDEVQPWIRYLDKEMADENKDDPVSYFLAKIIRESLLSTDESHIIKAADQIKCYYRFEYMSSDTFRHTVVGEETTNFLRDLYRKAFGTAMHIPFENPHQDILIELLLEFHKLIQQPSEVWNVCFSLAQW